MPMIKIQSAGGEQIQILEQTGRSVVYDIDQELLVTDNNYHQ